MWRSALRIFNLAVRLVLADRVAMTEEREDMLGVLATISLPLFAGRRQGHMAESMAASYCREASKIPVREDQCVRG